MGRELYSTVFFTRETFIIITTKITRLPTGITSNFGGTHEYYNRGL